MQSRTEDKEECKLKKRKKLLPGCEMEPSITAYMHGISFTWQSGVIWFFPGATQWFYLYCTPVRIPVQNAYSFLLNLWAVWYDFEAFRHILDYRCFESIS